MLKTMATSKRKSEASTEGRGASWKRPRQVDVVDEINALEKSDFLDRIQQSDEGWDNYTNQRLHKVELLYAADMKSELLHSCFELIETTSRHDYEPSSFGWHPKRKLREMQEKEMRYIMIRKKDRHGMDDLMGFMSFMFTHDSSPAVPVLYVYEIHLVPDARGCGLGKQLMHRAEALARTFQMEKVMLTCFKSNTNAYTFYESLGYEIDPCSPRDIKTRKKVSASDYLIMSLDPKRATNSSQAIEGASQEDPEQVNKDVDEACSVMFADVLTSSDEFDKGLKECSRAILDLYQHRRSNLATTRKVLQEFHAKDIASIQREASRLRRLLDLFRRRSNGDADFDTDFWSKLSVWKKMVDALSFQANRMNEMILDETLWSNKNSRESSGVSMVSLYREAEADFKTKKKELDDREHKIASCHQNSKKMEALLDAREQALARREETVSQAMRHIRARTKRLDEQEAAVALAVQEAHEYLLDDANHPQDDDDSERDEERIEESSEQDESETNTDYSNSKDEKSHRLTISSAKDLPTPEAMKWQRPNKSKVSTWLRRSGSARDSFPSGMRRSD